MYLDELRNGNDLKHNYYNPYNFGSRGFNRWFDGSSAKKWKKSDSMFKQIMGYNPNVDASRGLWMNTFLTPG